MRASFRSVCTCFNFRNHVCLCCSLWSGSSSVGHVYEKTARSETEVPKNYNHDNGRPLGIMEELLRRVHDTTGSLILADTLVLRSQKEITGSVVRKAMELLMRRHPNLHMCYQKNQNWEYHLQKMTTLKVDLREQNTTDWKSVMEESLLEKFDGKMVLFGESPSFQMLGTSRTQMKKPQK